MKFGRARSLHLVGIGGSGMCGIAEVLINLRYAVSGSDLADGETVTRLRHLGGRIFIGHAAEHVHGTDVVVTSTAVRADNPEILEARRLGIPVIPRAEMLAELMRMKVGIAVAGTHGKTSVTSMVAQVLHLGRLDPTIVIGGRLKILESSAKLGRGDLMVVEADESDGSFLKLRPRTAVITNIDNEHLDHYGDLAALVDAFVQFGNSVPFYGLVVTCIDDPVLRKTVPRLTRRVVSYGLSEDADLRATNVEMDGFISRFLVHAGDTVLGPMEIRAPGRHQVVNALAAVAVGLDCDLPFDGICAALESFEGADRRFQAKGEVDGVLVIDDYGHHPTEIRATLNAAKQGWGRPIVAVFQPHRYTRVRDLLDEFAGAFADATTVIVTDIYAAGEAPLAGITAESIVDALKQAGHPDVRLVKNVEDVAAALADIVRTGDLLLTLGAGSVTRVGGDFVKRQKQQQVRG